MTYLFRFFLKVILTLILINRTFSVLNYNLYLKGGGYWVLPLITLSFIINIIYDFIYLKHHNLWYKKVLGLDERSYIQTLKAGNICFRVALVSIVLIIIYYSFDTSYLINPINLLGLLLIICLSLFLILKNYFLYN